MWEENNDDKVASMVGNFNDNAKQKEEDWQIRR